MHLRTDQLWHSQLKNTHVHTRNATNYELIKLWLGCSIRRLKGGLVQSNDQWEPALLPADTSETQCVPGLTVSAGRAINPAPLSSHNHKSNHCSECSLIWGLGQKSLTAADSLLLTLFYIITILIITFYSQKDVIQSIQSIHQRPEKQRNNIKLQCRPLLYSKNMKYANQRNIVQKEKLNMLQKIIKLSA